MYRDQTLVTDTDLPFITNPEYQWACIDQHGYFNPEDQRKLCLAKGNYCVDTQGNPTAQTISSNQNCAKPSGLPTGDKKDLVPLNDRNANASSYYDMDV